MERAGFLTRVVLDNYKSIAHCDVRLGPLNYLVGPNGAGKSNFLDALRFVADALKHSVGQALLSRGGGGMVCHVPDKQERSFRIHLEFTTRDAATGQYTLKVGVRPEAPSSAPWEVLYERLDLPGKAGDAGSDLRSQPLPGQRLFLGERLALALVADDPVYRGVYTSLTRMLFYNIKPRSIEDVSTFQPGQFLLADGSNLASVVFRLRCSTPEAVERINEHLSVILPGLKQVRAEPVFRRSDEPALDTQKVALLFDQGVGSRVYPFWPSQMSDGMLRTLGYLTALLQAAEAEGPRPSLVAIEEPEAQVHPAVLAVVRSALVEASYSTQVLVTTQSADLLDSKDVSTDSILAFSAADGVTHIGPVDATGRDLIRDRLYTPGELLRIGHVFPAIDNNGSPPAPGPRALAPVRKEP